MTTPAVALYKYDVHTLAAMSEMEIWGLPPGYYLIKFADGEEITNLDRLRLSWYTWYLIKGFEETKLTKATLFTSRYYNDGSMIDTMSVVTRLIHEAYGEGKYNTEVVWVNITKARNMLYNKYCIVAASYQTHYSIFDLCEVYNHPVIKEAVASLKPTQASYDAVCAVISKVIMTDPALDKNRMCFSLRCKLVKMSQMLQILVSRMFVTEADSTIFPDPIMTGYFRGVLDVYSASIDTRSATKAMQFQGPPLQTVEYLNRRLQMGISRIKELIIGDCGSFHHTKVHVTPIMFRGIEGKWRWDEEDQCYKEVLNTDKHLIGTTIEIRTAGNCFYRYGHSVCSKCFGTIATSVPVGTVLGHVSVVALCEKGSQATLSVKHFDGSSTVIRIFFGELDKTYLYEHESNDGVVFIKKSLSKRKPYLVIPMTSQQPALNGSGLVALSEAGFDALKERSIYRVTSFKSVCFEHDDDSGEGRVSNYVRTYQHSRLGSFTEEFLEYVLKQGYTVTDDNMYQIDLKDWDYDKPFMQLPARHRNMLDFMAEVETFICSPSSSDRDGSKIAVSTRKLTHYNNVNDAIVDLYNLVNSELKVNIAHLEIIILALMSSVRTDEYRIPRVGEPYKFIPHRMVITGAQPGTLLGFERQPEVLNDISTYTNNRREAGIYDGLVLPY